MDEMVDWNKFKSEAKRQYLLKAQKSYIRLCELLNNNNHKLLNEYVSDKIKVLIDFNCGHKPHWIMPGSYKRGAGCPKCKNNCPEQAKEDLLKLVKKNNHKLLSEYITSSTKVLIDFNCGHEPNWIRPSCYKTGIR